MSTRCYIAQKTGNDVHFIYCHFDGYPESVGHTLKKYYDTEEKVTNLLNHGDRMSLHANVECGKFDPNGLQYNISCPYDSNSYHKLVSYHIVSYLEWLTFFKDTKNLTIEYYYLFDGGKWTCHDYQWKSINIYRKFRLRDDTKLVKNPRY